MLQPAGSLLSLALKLEIEEWSHRDSDCKRLCVGLILGRGLWLSRGFHVHLVHNTHFYFCLIMFGKSKRALGIFYPHSFIQETKEEWCWCALFMDWKLADYFFFLKSVDARFSSGFQFFPTHPCFLKLDISTLEQAEADVTLVSSLFAELW